MVDVTGISVNGATLWGSLVGVQAASAVVGGGSELQAGASAVSVLSATVAGTADVSARLGKQHAVGAALQGGSGTAVFGTRVRGLAIGVQGNSDATAFVRATYRPQAVLRGDGDFAATMTGAWLLSLLLPLRGGSSLQSYLGSPARVSTLLRGDSSLSAPFTTQITAQGVALGDAVAVGADRMVLAAAGTAQGVSSIVGDAWADLIVGGHVAGSSTAVIENQLAVGGLSAGSATTSASAELLLLVAGSVAGSSSAVISVPGIVHGTSNVAAHMVVDDLSPICSGQATSFRYGQLLQRGDLGIWFDGGVDPYEVTYTLCLQRRGGWVCVGPGKQIPVRDGNGEYHVAGFAGWESQPGTWCITWRYRKSSCSPTFEKSMPFKVCDATSCPDLCDGLSRVRKTGWLT